jgi:hypothetical protein
MHPELLRESPSFRGPLSSEPIPEIGRVGALRRIVARAAEEDPYPHCPRCGRALLAYSSTCFACPSGHFTLTSAPRGHSFWRWLSAAFGHRRVDVRA